MIKRPIRNQIVEHLSRLGEVSEHNISRKDDTTARTYHYHNTVEVILIKSGWAEGLIGEITGRLQQGTVAVLGSDVPHCVLRTSDDCSCILVHIPTELLIWDEDRFPELAHGTTFIRNSKSGMIYKDAELARKTARLVARTAAADGFMRISLLMQLLHLLSTTPPTSTVLAEHHRPNGVKAEETAIDKAYRYLYAHYREQLTLSDLASFAGLNSSALCRSFKKASGGTIGQYLSRLRIEYACNLLLTTNTDVARIAYKSGYNSYPHFCAQFKKHMKMSPTEYRQGADTRHDKAYFTKKT